MRKLKLDGKLMPPIFGGNKLRMDIISYYADVEPPMEVTNACFFGSFVKNQ
jgi:hypothetical protein